MGIKVCDLGFLDMTPKHRQQMKKNRERTSSELKKKNFCYFKEHNEERQKKTHRILENIFKLYMFLNDLFLDYIKSSLNSTKRQKTQFKRWTE